MINKDKQFTVRIDEPPDTPISLRRFAAKVSAALTALWRKVKSMTPASYARGVASAPSLSMMLLDPLTGQIVFLPGVRFIVAGSSDVNVGFELDVSGAIGQGIGGTVQGYTANYGTLFGTKLTAGIMANNEDANTPRLDVGFKVKRGATMELYGTDGVGNDRAGQVRMTIGPDGGLIVVRYVSGNRWEFLGGFDKSHAFVCGWRNTGWPGSGNTYGGTTAPVHPFNVYGRSGGVGTETAYTKRPMATISDDGRGTFKSLKIENGDNEIAANTSATFTLTGTPNGSNLVFQVMEKTFDDGSTGYVLCSPT